MHIKFDRFNCWRNLWRSSGAFQSLSVVLSLGKKVMTPSLSEVMQNSQSWLSFQLYAVAKGKILSDAFLANEYFHWRWGISPKCNTSHCPRCILNESQSRWATSRGISIRDVQGICYEYMLNRSWNEDGLAVTSEVINRIIVTTYLWQIHDDALWQGFWIAILVSHMCIFQNLPV